MPRDTFRKTSFLLLEDDKSENQEEDALSERSDKCLKLDKVNCARLRRPYVGLGGSVKVMGECSVSQLILGVMRF